MVPSPRSLARLLSLSLVLAAPRLNAQALVPAWTATEEGLPLGLIPAAARFLDDGTLLTIFGHWGALTLLHSDAAGAPLGTAVIQVPYSFSVPSPRLLVDGFGGVFVGADGWTSTAIGAEVWRYDGLTGLPLWTAPWRSDASAPSVVTALARDEAGGIFVATARSGVGVVFKLAASTGAATWESPPLVGPGGVSFFPAVIAVDPAGDVVLGGWVSANGTQYASFAKLSGTAGALLAGPAWNPSAPASGFWPCCIAPLSGGAVIAGGFNAPDMDALVTRFDASGSTVWARALDDGGHGWDVPSALALTPNGDVYVTAASQAQAAGANGTEAFRLSGSDGSVVWGPAVVSDPGATWVSPSTVAVTREGHLLVRASSAVDPYFPDGLLWELDGPSGALRWPVARVVRRGTTFSPLPILLSREGDIVFVGAGTDTGKDLESVLARFSEGTGALLSPPVRLPAARSSVSARHVLGDAAGDAVAALSFYDGSSSDARFVKYAGGTGQRLWGPVRVGSTDSTGLRVARDAAGDVLWASWADGGNAISIGKLRGSDGAVLWGPQAWSPFAANSSLDSIAVDSRGYLVVGATDGGTNAVGWFRGDTGALAFPAASWSTTASFQLAVDASDGVSVLESNGDARRFTETGAPAWGPVRVTGYDPVFTPDAAGNLVVASADRPGQILVTKLSVADGSTLFSRRTPDSATYLVPAKVLLESSGNVLLTTTEYLGSSPEAPFPPEAVVVRRVSGLDGALLAGPASWVGPDTGFAQTVDAALDGSGNILLCVRAHDGTAYRPVLLGAPADLSSLAPVAEYRERNDAYPFSFAISAGRPLVAGSSGGRGSSFVVAFGTPFALATQPSVVPPASCGVPYTFPFAAVNGAPPYSFLVASGALPPGLSLDPPTGSVSGTPSAVGTFPFRLEVADAAGRSASRDYAIAVAPGPDVPILATANPLCPRDSTTLSVAGGWGRYLWLPGLEKTPTITVRPLHSAPFGVVVSDPSGCTRRGSIEIVVNVPGALAITAPASAPAHASGLSAGVEAHAGSTYAWAIVGGTIGSGQGTPTIGFTAGAGGVLVLTVTESRASGCEATGTRSVAVAPSPTGFYTLAPCRLLDTRVGGKGPIAAGETRRIAVAGTCGVPGGALSIAINATAVNGAAAGLLALTPSGEGRGEARVLAWNAAQTRAAFAVLPLGASGALDAYAEMPSGNVDLVLDVSGYFR